MVNRVNANPDMIKWARENAGFKIEDLPKTLHNVPLWENGDLKPTWNDLRNLAKKYKRPSIFYLRSEPPKVENNDIIEFRSDDHVKDFSPQLTLEINKAKFRRNAYINLHNEMNIKLNNFSKNIISEEVDYNDKYIKHFAKVLRNLLNISIEKQSEWIYKPNETKDYLHTNFLYEWKELISDLGVLIFETEEVPEEEMSGLCLYYNICPIILLNGKNKPNRRIFTLIHELIHLMTGKSTICDVDIDNKKEYLCNRISAEFLIPTESLENTKISKNKAVKNHKIDDWNSRDIGTLSHMFGVSKQSVIIQLYNISKISKNFKDLELKKLKDHDIELKIKEKERQNNSGGMNPVEKSKKYVGKPFSRFILSAYENNIIGPTEFKKYTNLSIDSINSLYDKLV
jgi:Zn-dependent peptidase ImmA (M78 family)